MISIFSDPVRRFLEQFCCAAFIFSTITIQRNVCLLNPTLRLLVPQEHPKFNFAFLSLNTLLGNEPCFHGQKQTSLGQNTAPAETAIFQRASFQLSGKNLIVQFVIVTGNNLTTNTSQKSPK